MAEQPMPVPSDRRPIVDMVREDLAERMRIGIQRYGTPLQADNGRDALRDAYEEALDLACYLRQAIEERDNPRPDPVEMRVRALMEGVTLDKVLAMPSVVGQAIMEEPYCARVVRRGDEKMGVRVICGQSASAHAGNALGHPMGYGRPVFTAPETGWYQVLGTLPSGERERRWIVGAFEEDEIRISHHARGVDGYRCTMTHLPTGLEGKSDWCDAPSLARGGASVDLVEQLRRRILPGIDLLRGARVESIERRGDGLFRATLSDPASSARGVSRWCGTEEAAVRYALEALDLVKARQRPDPSESLLNEHPSGE